MSDIFNEYMITRLPDRATVFKRIGIIAACVVLCAVIALAAIIFTPFMALLVTLMAGVIYLTVNLVRRFDIEYEYILTNDTLDIDKIIAKSKRTGMISVNVREFEILAPVSDNYTAELDAEYTSIYDFSAGAVSEDRWFAIFEGVTGRSLLVFEPPERMVSGIKTFNARAVKDK